ncbi:FAD/FMN-containing isoamyl alcohol oxidase-like protein MreA [Xylaria arbuscula]|nr:FAD/FMN-containing isoamyl alcohol oxidase-like protein MreA [Xylaria arbuscula]
MSRFLLIQVACLFVLLPFVRAGPVTASSTSFTSKGKCRLLPGDAGWPKENDWQHLNRTVGGRLIRGVPLGQPCHTPLLNSGVCAQIQEDWTLLEPFVDNPVSVMSPYWVNNSCSPFTASDGRCALGNLAQYAINVSSAQDVIAGIRFAQEKNVRLTIKNTGHDFLGRSTGKGSLALWMHNLKQIQFLNYRGKSYTGPAVRLGAGVEYGDVYPGASARRRRVVGGASPTVSVAGGFSQGAGHGPLGTAYGLGADQVLEWEVVTAAGNVLTASPVENEELYWALTGGGPGNYAVVLSATVRTYPDGPVSGAGFTFTNVGDTAAYWAAISAWFQHMLVLDTVPGLSTVFTLTAKSFSLVFSTLPDAKSTRAIDAALAPFLDKLAGFNVSLGNSYQSRVDANFAAFYDYWSPRMTYDSNITLGSSLVPRATVRDADHGLPALVAAFREITAGGALVLSVGVNVRNGSHAQNAVLPAWRDALFTTTFARSLPVDAGWEAIRANQAQLNAWQDSMRTATSWGGAYMNEATWDNVNWKQDYFGPNYDALLRVKAKYDPQHVFWANAAVGSDKLLYGEDGRLCPV